MNTREWVSVLLPGALLAQLVLSSWIVDDARAGEIKPITTVSEIQLRTAPTADSHILILIPKGTSVGLGDCSSGWCRVSWNGQDGYVLARKLKDGVALSWQNAPLADWPSDGQWQKAKKIEFAGGREEGAAEHSVVLEIGTAGEWPFNGERSNFGGTIAAEIEPIENWLELEFGLSTLATAGHTELSGDLLFKKPFRLSPTVEFMVGAGPSFSRTVSSPEQGNSWSAEFALDWMFWPTKNVGWFIEPTWSVNPRNGQQSAGVSLGMLIGFPK